jgi:hypothetical protein
MGYRKIKRKNISEEEIDEMVIAQANDNSAWDKPVRVRKLKQPSLSLPAALAARAAFFARLHREANLADRRSRIIREKLDIEEAAFAGFKRELLLKSTR